MLSPRDSPQMERHRDRLKSKEMERQMPYDFTYIRNLKNKINKNNRYRKHFDTVRWQRAWGEGRRMK